MARTSRRRRDYSNREHGYRGYISPFVQALREQGEHVVQAAKIALEFGVEDVVEEAKSRCPVVTGALKNSIKAVDVEDGAAFEIRAGAKNKKGISYGQFVEYAPWGTPFLIPALDANVDRIRNNIKLAIRNAIRRGR